MNGNFQTWSHFSNRTIRIPVRIWKLFFKDYLCAEWKAMSSTLFEICRKQTRLGRPCPKNISAISSGPAPLVSWVNANPELLKFPPMIRSQDSFFDIWYLFKLRDQLICNNVDHILKFRVSINLESQSDPDWSHKESTPWVRKSQQEFLDQIEPELRADSSLSQIGLIRRHMIICTGDHNGIVSDLTSDHVVPICTWLHCMHCDQIARTSLHCVWSPCGRDYTAS